jgi:hypothetical protein
MAPTPHDGAVAGLDAQDVSSLAGEAEPPLGVGPGDGPRPAGAVGFAPPTAPQRRLAVGQPRLPRSRRRPLPIEPRRPLLHRGRRPVPRPLAGVVGPLRLPPVLGRHRGRGAHRVLWRPRPAARRVDRPRRRRSGRRSSSVRTATVARRSPGSPTTGGRRTAPGLHATASVKPAERQMNASHKGGIARPASDGQHQRHVFVDTHRPRWSLIGWRSTVAPLAPVEHVEDRPAAGGPQSYRKPRDTAFAPATVSR